MIVYILLCGFPPFYGDNDAAMFRNIKSGTYSFLRPYWDPISSDAKDFVEKLLVVDPRKRLTAAEALHHRWLGRTAKVPEKNLFEAKKGQPNAPPKQAGAAAPPADEAGEERGATGLRAMLMDYNLDRKVGLRTKFRKAFPSLPETEERVGKFKCSLGNQPGHLFVTTRHICFHGSIGRKLVIPLVDVTSIAKAKRFKLHPGSGHSLHIASKKERHELHGFTEREACLKTICKQCLVTHDKVPEIIDPKAS